MAYELSAGGANVKLRSPWAPIGLGIITLGIYDAVWYYKINRETGGPRSTWSSREGQGGVGRSSLTAGDEFPARN